VAALRRNDRRCIGDPPGRRPENITERAPSLSSGDDVPSSAR
jgi:hypothetical protein